MSLYPPLACAASSHSPHRIMNLTHSNTHVHACPRMSRHLALSGLHLVSCRKSFISWRPRKLESARAEQSPPTVFRLPSHLPTASLSVFILEPRDQPPHRALSLRSVGYFPNPKGPSYQFPERFFTFSCRITATWVIHTPAKQSATSRAGQVL